MIEIDLEPVCAAGTGNGDHTKAINVDTVGILGIRRRRCPLSDGVLATAGGPGDRDGGWLRGSGTAAPVVIVIELEKQGFQLTVHTAVKNGSNVLKEKILKKNF